MALKLIIMKYNHHKYVRIYIGAFARSIPQVIRRQRTLNFFWRFHSNIQLVSTALKGSWFFCYSCCCCLLRVCWHTRYRSAHSISAISVRRYLLFPRDAGRDIHILGYPRPREMAALMWPPSRAYLARLRPKYFPPRSSCGGNTHSAR